MIDCIHWLSERKSLNYVLVILYVIVLLSLHDTFVNLSVWIMQKLTLDRYDRVILVIAFLSLGMLGYLFFKNWRLIRQHSSLKMVLLLGSILFLVLHLNSLLVLNIELIHALQFGLLALLIFPLSRSFAITLCMATMIGYVDEYYQYQYLYPNGRIILILTILSQTNWGWDSCY